MNNDQLIAALNNMLSQEHACAIRYATHAAVVSGPYADAVSSRLKEISSDETRHAEMLRDRILALGGTPTMQVKAEDLKPAASLSEILNINIEEEHGAIRGYTEILKSVPASNVILHRSIEDILRDEQEHVEELEALKAEQ